jgi:hypothetical protein
MDEKGCFHVQRARGNPVASHPGRLMEFFEMLFNQAFPPPQPDLFLAEEIARLKSVPND